MPYTLHWTCTGCKRKWDSDKIATPADPRTIREDWHTVKICDECAGAGVVDIARAPKKTRSKRDRSPASR